MQTQINEPKNEWGGPWTERKLDAFTKYVQSYLRIMQNNPYWRTIYFDGFAGSGKKEQRKSDLLRQLAIEYAEERVYEGSAERVIKIKDDLAFDFYYFIDTKESSLRNLERHLKNLPEVKNKKLAFKHGDANQYILELGSVLKRAKPGYAGLILLDPFGMQISWSSIASLKDTRSDIWILVPTGVIVNRLLDRKGELKSLKKLESFFGLNEEEIRQHFYETGVTHTLFGGLETVNKVLQPIEKIASLYTDRLKTIWKYVTPQPMRLDNSKGVPIFHFVFASNNATAVKIAKQIIEKS